MLGACGSRSARRSDDQLTIAAQFNVCPLARQACLQRPYETTHGNCPRPQRVSAKRGAICAAINRASRTFAEVSEAHPAASSLQVSDLHRLFVWSIELRVVSATSHAIPDAAQVFSAAKTRRLMARLSFAVQDRRRRGIRPLPSLWGGGAYGIALPNRGSFSRPSASRPKSYASLRFRTPSIDRHRALCPRPLAQHAGITTSGLCASHHRRRRHARARRFVG